MLRHILALLTLFILHGNGQVVDTQYGSVEGNTVTLEGGMEIMTFYSIPYAKPPTGALRFQPPEEPEPWEGVLDARNLPTACIQELGDLQWPGNPQGITMDEDCLYLNVYTPQILEPNLAVMVWIHGGGYFNGMGVLHPGHFLAAKNVVMVSMNYRLRAFGFMTSGDDVAPGNYGLLDQIRVLEFVRDNIAVFGGDPGQVTIFGESAGGSSVGLLGLSPPAQGLFHQMITQSGSDMHEWAFLGPNHQPDQYTRQVAAQVDCPSENSQEMMDCLREVPWENLWNRTFECVPGQPCIGFAPVVDGFVLPDHPWTLRTSGQFAHVPLMSGITSEDGSIGVITVAPDTLFRGLNRSEFLNLLNETVFERINVHYPGNELDVYEAFNFFYTPWPHIDDLDVNREAMVVLYTDYNFGVGTEIQMSFQAEVSPVFHYVFGYASENYLFPEWMGVRHSEELAYEFGIPLLQRHPEVREDSKIFEDYLPWNEQDMEWSDYFITLWTNFAKFKHPTPTPIIPPGSESPVTWEERTNENQQYLFMHATDTALLQNYRPQNMAFWLQYLPYLVGQRPPTIPK